MSTFNTFVFLTMECTSCNNDDDNPMKTICLISCPRSTMEEGKHSNVMDKLLLNLKSESGNVSYH